MLGGRKALQAESALRAGSGLGEPCNFDLPMLGDTITEVQIDEALIGNSRIGRHLLEVGHDIFG